jgi:WD40 repeat protein/serine/threonine protein kinase
VLHVLEGYLAELERGVLPHPDELLARHPDLAEPLKAYLASLDFLHRAAVSLHGPPRPDSPRADDPDAPGRLGDFRILREVGRGGMGVVYEAEQISLARRVALKVLPFAATMDSRQLQRFQNEARAAASLEHPHIVPVYGVGCERGVHYYTMKFIDGKSLAQVIADLRVARPESSKGVAGPKSTPFEDSGRATPVKNGGSENTVPVAALTTQRAPRDKAAYRQIAEWGIQAAEALEHAHSLGIVHRDIKPANLMIENSPASADHSPLTTHHSPKLWITDFGLARTAADAGLTITGDVLGTLRYMSPEQALAKHGLVDHRTDVYSLGVTLYELLTGRPAVEGKDREEILNAITRDEPQRPRALDASIPQDLETILLKAIAKTPSERYATARELADDLRRSQEQRPIHARRPTLLQRVSKWAGRHQRAVVLSLAVLLLMVLMLTVSMALIVRSEAEAVEQREQAQGQRRRAEDRERDLWRQGYPANILAAHHAWQVGNLEQARELLEQYLPREGREDLRGFEWKYLWNLCREELEQPRVLRGHRGAVFYATYSPDGKLLATCGQDQTTRLWDATTGELLKTFLGHVHDVNCVLFTRDGRLLVTASDDGSIRTWNVTTGKQRSILAWVPQLNPHWLLPFPHPFVGFPLFVEAAHIALSPDERTLAAAYWDGTVRLYDFPAGTERMVLRAHPPKAEAVAFGSDGRILVTGGRDGTAKVWDLATGKLVFTPQEKVGVVKSVAAARTVPLIALANYHGKIAVWNPVTGKELLSFTEGSKIQHVAFSADDKWLVACSDSGVVCTLEHTTAKLLNARQESSGRLWCVAFSPDGNTQATAGQDGTVLLTPRRRDPAPWISSVEHLALQRDGTTLVAAHGNCVRWFDTRFRRPEQDTLRLPPTETSWCLSADGQTLLTHDGDRVLRIWDLKWKKLRATLPPYDAPLAVRLSGDGRTLYTSPWDKPIIRAWDTATGAELRPISEPDLSGGYIWLSRDGRLLTTYNYPNLLVRASESHRVLARLTVSYRGVHSAAYCWQGKKLAIAWGNLSIVLDDLETGQRSAPLLGHQGPIYSMAFSPDGKTLASASCDGTVKLWHVATAKEMLTLKGHRGRVGFVAFSRDGSLLVSRGDGADSQGEAFLWDGRDYEMKAEP